MRRREFITLLSGAAAAWPLAARAQRPTMPIVGVLDISSSEANADRVARFRKGLSETGYVEGRNLAIEFRWANNELDRVPELAADLVRRRVAVIAAFAAGSALAAKSATATIPIVFFAGGDPVQAGLVAALNHPGGNVTGISILSVEMTAKRLELLHELLPTASRFGLLVRRGNPNSEFVINEAQVAASAMGKHLEILYVGNNSEIDAAFASFVQNRIDAVVMIPSGLFGARRAQIIGLAAHYSVPVMYDGRDYVKDGGLMSYGPIVSDPPRQVGIYTGRILKGEKPGDLPVIRSTKFEFVINLQAAKLIGIDVPPTLLALADEVIE
jgi:putative ABC transport system substrate-binding protein